MSPSLNYKALLYATPTHLPSICPFTRPHVIISALSMHLPPVLWAWIRAPATHFLGARILTTLPLSIPPAAFSALPQHLPSPFSVIILSSQYLFQRGPIWITGRRYRTSTYIACNCTNLLYAIRCLTCGKVYVGQTKRRLMDPLMEHFRNIRQRCDTHIVGRHYNTQDHTGIWDLTVHILEFIPAHPDSSSASALRDSAERKWIYRLRSLVPTGLNVLN